jgi:hypothetical protein
MSGVSGVRDLDKLVYRFNSLTVDIACKGKYNCFHYSYFIQLDNVNYFCPLTDFLESQVNYAKTKHGRIGAKIS